MLECFAKMADFVQAGDGKAIAIAQPANEPIDHHFRATNRQAVH